MQNAVAIPHAAGHVPGTMKGSQVRAARELLGLTQQQLCEAVDVSAPTMRAIENETGDPKRSSLNRVEEYFRSRGIRFVHEPGVIGLPPFQDPQK